MLWNIAIATDDRRPELERDGQLLAAELSRLGVTATPAVWTDPGIAWCDFDLVLLRSTWDYHLRHAEFLSWLDRVPQLVNPATMVRWNLDKHYLLDLAEAGVPIVPTRHVRELTAAETDLVATDLSQAGDLVVKPTVGASAHGAFRCRSTDVALRRIEQLLETGQPVLVQPYLDAVDTTGETSLVYLAGEFSHAFRRSARLISDADEPLPNTTTATTATVAEVTVSEQALAAAPGPLSYARVDLLPGPDGQPPVSELELIEPGLRLDLAEPAAVRRWAAQLAIMYRS